MGYLIFRKEHFGNWIFHTLQKLLYNATTYYTTKTSIRQVIFTENFPYSKKKTTPSQKRARNSRVFTPLALKKEYSRELQIIRYKSFIKKLLHKNTLCLILSVIQKKGSRQNSLLTRKGFVGIISILIFAGLIYIELVEYDANAIFSA